MQSLTNYDNYIDSHRRNAHIILKGEPVIVDADKLYKEQLPTANKSR